jgi:hypothetical protein
MKIYLSSTPPTDQNKSYQWISNISVFDSSVMTSEASSIICDNFLSTLPMEQIEVVIGLIASKMRIGCELIILSPDITTLSQRMTKEEIDLNMLNAILFKNGPIRSVCSMEFVEVLLPANLTIFHKHFDLHTSEIVIKARRSS